MKKKLENFLPPFFFLLVLVTGIAIYKDYGLSWDEPIQRQLGLATWDYIAGQNDSLLHLQNVFYNPFIELLEVLPEKILHLQSEKEIYLSRHLFNFIFCWIGLIFFYRLALLLFHDYRSALLSCIMLLLTPRIFAHCFYNSKDLPFMFLFVWSIYFFIAWLKSPTWGNVVVMVISSGMLTGARVIGVLFTAIVVILLVICFLKRRFTRMQIKMMIVFLVFYPFSVFIFFPGIWHNPFALLDAMNQMSHFPTEITTYFMGQTISSLQTPWYYDLVWWGITIPVGWLLLFLAGIPMRIIHIARKEFEMESAVWLTILVWLFLPLSLVVGFQAHLYDDARHLFFLIPPLILIAVYAIQFLFQPKIFSKKIMRWSVFAVASVVLISTIAYTTIFMIRNHPYQYSYFNAIGRKYAADDFEKDYWGLSYRQALEFLVKYDRSQQLNVIWKVNPGEYNLIWLKDSDRERIHKSTYDQCDYFITNFRNQRPEDASDQKIYEIKVQGITISAIYKMNSAKLIR